MWFTPTIALIIVVECQGGSPMADHKSLVWNSVGSFGHRLLASAQKGNSNTLVSPLSVHAALSMALLGASNTTSVEMAQVLGINMKTVNENLLTIGYSEFLKDLASLSESPRNRPFYDYGMYYDDFYGDISSGVPVREDNFKFHIANGIYLSSLHPTNMNYMEAVKEYFKADAVTVDFSEGTQKIVQHINRFVATKTEGMIKSIIEDVLPHSYIELISAVYYKGVWETRLEKKPNITWMFNEGCGPLSSTDVKWMQATDKVFRYMDSSALDAQIIEIPYKAAFPELSATMLIILPNKNHTCQADKWFKRYSWQTVRAALAAMWNLSGRRLNLTMPMFDIENTHDITGLLPKMGMSKAFSPAANFGNIFEEHLPGTPIDLAFHKTKIIVDGDVSLAAFKYDFWTRQLLSVRNELTTPIQVVIDRSFYFAILLKSPSHNFDNILPLLSGVVHEV